MENAQPLMFLKFLKDLKEQKLLMLLQTLRLLKEQKELEELAEFKQKIFDLYAKGRRDSSLPPNTRTWDRPALLWARLGNFIGNVFAGAIDFNTDDCVPSAIFRIKRMELDFHVELLDVTFEREGISLSSANREYTAGRKFGVIGYDTEFLPAPGGKLLSHQFCFDYGLGKRFAFALDTDIRFTDETFLLFIRTIIAKMFSLEETPKKKKPSTDGRGRRVAKAALKPDIVPIRQWSIFAHFSLAEGSWVDSSQKKLIERMRKEWRGTVNLSNPRIVKDNEEKQLQDAAKAGKAENNLAAFFAITGIEKTVEPKQETPAKKTKKKKNLKISLSFGDTMNLDPRSLKKIADGCGLEKITFVPLEGDKDCDATYKHFDRFRDERPAEFYRYGIRDAIITSGIAIVLHTKFGVESKFQLRTAKYSETHIAEWFSKNYNGICDSWQRVIGQTKIRFEIKKKKGKKSGTSTEAVVLPPADTKPEDAVPKFSEKWLPSKLQQHILQEWYKGGRNEARRIGCFDENVSYFDMTSAYPTAIAALRRDYDFSNPIIRTRSDGAAERVKQLIDKGPFQPHGIYAYVRFRKDCKVPMAPISTVAGIIYPMENEGQVICWPEYWTAEKLGIIEESFIFAFYEFPELETRKFPDYILELLKNRKTEKVFYKSILNFLSGKLAQGRKKGIPHSSITCPALAAYLTSVTRAAAAEIGNLNDYYAITTDGIISPTVEKLKFGEINLLLEKRQKDIEFEWMKNEFSGDKVVIWKTRGYIIVKSTAAKDAPAKERFKQAKMGLQGEEPCNVIEQVISGKGIRKSAKTFAELDDGEVFEFLENEFDVNPNYDFKYSINEKTIRDQTIKIDGHVLTMPCFETKPLRNIIEHLELREICDRWSLRNLHKKPLAEGEDTTGKKPPTKSLSAQDLKKLLMTALLNDGRCRHMQWEFRKRLMQTVDRKETKLHVNSYNVVRKKPLFKIPAIYGDIREFLPILEREVRIVKNRKRRPELLEQIIVQMENDRGGYVDVSEQITEEEFFFREDRMVDSAEGLALVDQGAENE